MLRQYSNRICLALLLALVVPISSRSITQNDAVRTGDGYVSLQSANGRALAARGEETSQRSPGSSGVLLSVDDGSVEGALGVVSTDPQQTSGNQAFFLNRFSPTASQLPLTIDSVSILFPTSTSAGSTFLQSGQFFELLIFVDPSGSGLPANTTKKVQQGFTIQPSNTEFQEILLSLPIVIQSGDVWIGFTNTVTATDNRPLFPAAIDTTPPSLGRSWVFFNGQVGDHFNGPLDTADNQVVLNGNWLIRANGQTGGLTCFGWQPPVLSRGTLNPPPTNAAQCGTIPPLGRPDLDSAAGRGTGTLLGYKVYRASQPGVQPVPGNLFASTPPTQTSIGASVSPTGSFFIVTANYDTGESAPSNEVAYVPPSITTFKIKPTKLVVNGTNLTANGVSLFIDGLPFVTAPVIKKNNTRIVQKGTLITGQTLDQYLTANGQSATLIVRNSNGALASRTIAR